MDHDYDRWMRKMWKMIKQLEERCDSLEEKIDGLESRLDQVTGFNSQGQRAEKTDE